MEKIIDFDGLGIEKGFVKALQKMSVIRPTVVQLKAVPMCLLGKDVVVQAKTGSGKTLAFLLPLVESLRRLKCSADFGVQAVILVPTAELALQTTNVLSALLADQNYITYLSVIGGKCHTEQKEEWSKINEANIVISTLGRLLEHLERNAILDLSNVKYFIIDETDYLLEETFFVEMEALVNYLPKNRINWLFSATQSSVIDELSRLALNKPIFIGIDDKTVSLPKNLTQCFRKIELQDKLQALWNLLEAQHKSNVIVFFSTQKQVLFVYRLFSRLNPAYNIVQLRSNMRLDKRSHAMESLLSSKGGCVLLATDVASRGLDFPKVSLVIQYDLPREFDYYIHRAGRTARYDSKGTSLLMIMPSEMGFLTLLKEKNIIMKKLSSNVLKSYKRSVAERASLLYTTDIELFTIAKNAFLAYLRDYAKTPSRLHAQQTVSNIFVVNKLPVKLFSQSMGFKTIPDEESTMALVQPGLTSQEPDFDKRPFLTVKKKVNDDDKVIKRKLNLDMSDDSDVEEPQLKIKDNEADEVILPAFNFEEILSKLIKSSKKDKEYFLTKLKPLYHSKRSKRAKKEGQEDMERDDDFESD